MESLNRSSPNTYFLFLLALTVRYLTGKFIYDYATGEDFIYPHQINLNKVDIQINIVDTSQNVSSYISIPWKAIGIFSQIHSLLTAI